MQYNNDVNKDTIKPHVKINKKVIKDLEDTARDVLIVLLKNRGASLTEIAKVFGLNKSTVSRIVQSNKELLSSSE